MTEITQSAAQWVICFTEITQSVADRVIWFAKITQSASDKVICAADITASVSNNTQWLNEIPERATDITLSEADFPVYETGQRPKRDTAQAATEWSAAKAHFEQKLLGESTKT